MVEKLKVFVIMPFNEDYFALFNKLKDYFKEKFDFTNAGDLDNQRNIIRDIVDGIYKADVIIADLTGLNANVFYELGIAHAMNKKVIIITQDIDELPFDIKSYRANEYSLQFNKLPNLLEKIDQFLQGAISGDIQFGNPISDYIPTYFNCNGNKNKETNMQKDSSNAVGKFIAEVDDSGYLDFIDEIKDNASKLGIEITDLMDEMNEMNIDISMTLEDIVSKKNGDNINMSYARMACRKLAEPIDFFSKKMNNHIAKIIVFWNIVENNYLSLLDNPYSKQEKNKENIKKSIQELKSMQNSLRNSEVEIISLISNLRGSKGMERKLNNAISGLINEFEKYLSMINTMYSSIDRISFKSELLMSE